MIGSAALPTASQLIPDVLYNPLTDAKFLIPVISLLVISLVMKHYARKSSLTAPPSFEQKREKFLVPGNRFNLQVARVTKMDDQYFLNEVDSNIEKMKDLERRYANARKRYNRIIRRLRTSPKYKIRKGEDDRKNAFSEIIAIYDEIRSIKMNFGEVESRNEQS